MERLINWDRFQEEFKPIQNTVSNREEFNGWLFETYGEDDQHVLQVAKESPRKVWTIVDGDDDLIIISGWHYVNRFGYIICDVEFNENESITVID